MQDRILLVEDSKTFGFLVSRYLQFEKGFEVDWAQTALEATQLLKTTQRPYFAGLLDLNLPDAPYGQIVDTVTTAGVPSIVFTGQVSPLIRKRMWAKGIVDYVLKEGMHNLDYIGRLLTRLQKNRETTLLVVDDSISSQRLLTHLLSAHLYKIMTANNGEEALAVLEKNPQTKMIITDCNMPVMDGLTLTRKIRRTIPKEQLAIIGLSGKGGADTSASFLKYGANDYLNKPFLAEELYCRIMQNIDIIDYIIRVRDLSEKDFLTQLSNRRHFFDVTKKLLTTPTENSQNISIAMLDIDHFKNINDTYGHDTGDSVIRFLANQLQAHVSENGIVARFGGEEFCVLTTQRSSDDVIALFESLRKTIESSYITIADNTIRFTVSIGICIGLQNDVDTMIKLADKQLYHSKNTGRNTISWQISRSNPEKIYKC